MQPSLLRVRDSGILLYMCKSHKSNLPQKTYSVHATLKIEVYLSRDVENVPYISADPKIINNANGCDL